MKHSSLLASLLLFSSLAMANGVPTDTEPVSPNAKYSPGVMATVFNRTRVKIIKSNNVTLRPGSVYDNVTFFESLFELPQPGFNYEFVDSGLGTAEPLYPMYQKGHQESYFQLLPSLFSKSARHIDHYTSLDTPEGCKVDSIYLLRSLNEYSADEFVKERAEGYDETVIKLEYYTRLKPDVQCGRHRMNDFDPNFDPMAYMKAHHNAMSLSEFPKKYLKRFEAKQSVIFQLVEELHPTWPRFDLNKFDRNSLWYYPAGHAFNYGIETPRPQPGLSAFNLPEHMVVPATAATQAAFPLTTTLSDTQFKQVIDFMSGKPTPNFDPATEPGHDTLFLTDVTPKNFYTTGLRIEHIKDVVSDVSNPQNYKMVAMAIKPYEDQEDVSWPGTKIIPQIRFVYQMMSPRVPNLPYEQLYFHLKWDVVDRNADDATRAAQLKYFLSRVDQLTQARASGANSDAAVKAFITEFTKVRPIETIAFSSSLTGIWIFGTLTRDYSVARNLEAMRVVRNGIDVGYYSSAYDNDIFRAEIANTTGPRQASLQQQIDDITVTYFRDPKRQDAHAINFNRVTCSQCHQMSARDGVHMSFNDGLDRRFTSPINVTEFFFHDADLQLQAGAAGH